MTDPPKGPKAIELEMKEFSGEKRRKPIMVGQGSTYNLDDVKQAIQLFGVRGLHITVHAKSIREANKFVKQIEKITSRL
jgi:hypothetical protein